MVKIINKIINIIKGTYFNLFNKHQDKADFRLKICKNCSHKKSIKGIEICDLCGCILESKTRVEDEHCELDKW